MKLTYRGIEWCDGGCGKKLEQGEWMAGLCAACRVLVTGKKKQRIEVVKLRRGFL